MRSDLAAVLRLRPESYVPDGPDAADDAQSVTEHVTPEPAAGRAAGSAPAAVTLRGGQLTAWDQSAAALRMAIAVARRQWKDRADREGGVIHGLMRATPPSVQDQCDYARSRAWVPAGHDGGIAEKSGVAYHALLGKPGVAFFGACLAIVARPLRFAIAFLVAYALAVIVLFALGYHAAAFWMLAGLAGLAGLWLLAVRLWPDRREAVPDAGSRAA